MTQEIPDEYGGQPRRRLPTVEQLRIAHRRRRRIRAGDFGAGVEGHARRPFVMTEGARLRRPVEISERPGEPAELMLGAVVIPVDRSIGRHSSLGCLRRRHAPVDLFDRLRQLRPTTFVRGGGELAFEFQPRQT